MGNAYADVDSIEFCEICGNMTGHRYSDDDLYLICNNCGNEIEISKE